MKPAPLYVPLADVLYLCAASCNLTSLNVNAEAMILALYVSPESPELDKQQIITLMIIRQNTVVQTGQQVSLPVVLSHNAHHYIDYTRITEWEVISDRSTDSWREVEKHIDKILAKTLKPLPDPSSSHRASIKFFVHGHPTIIQLANVEFDKDRKKCKVTLK